MQKINHLSALLILLLSGCSNSEDEVNLTANLKLYYAHYADRQYIISDANSQIVPPQITGLYVFKDTVCGHLESTSTLVGSGYFVLAKGTNYFGLSRKEMEEIFARASGKNPRPLILHDPSFYFKNK